MAKFKIHKFDPVIYPRKVWVAKGGTKNDIAELFFDYDNDPYYLNGCVIKSSYAITDGVIERSTVDLGILIWLHSIHNITTGAMSHEADHAANRIFRDIGAKVDCDNDETHAYLV